MRVVFVPLVAATFFIAGAEMGQAASLLDSSRDSTVMISSRSADSKGTGFLIGDQHVLTCFHVIAAISVQGQTVNFRIHPDIEITLPSGETMAAAVASTPTQTDPAPLQHDFAVLKLKTKPSKSTSKLPLASGKEPVKVGDEVVFSGYPLATPGMVTHRGMVSGFDPSGALIFVQASINKGNSGGALLNARGQVVGIISMREGGIGKGLTDLSVSLDQAAAQGQVQLLGVDPLQGTKAIIQTLDRYISTGIGYARSVKFVNEYLAKNPGVLK